jgi:SAM-dependent methyltransferase
MWSTEKQIIEMGPWLKTPAGRYAGDWLQTQLDRAVADAFGFHAIQLGLPEVDGLRANRMPHRWVIEDAMADPLIPRAAATAELSAGRLPASVCAEFLALPFPSASIDLVVLPHTLELASDPHATLAEVERVLMPEGRVVILGFNPLSLWGLRQWSGFSDRFGRRESQELQQERHVAEFLGYRRVRDWLRLLSFEVDGGRFGIWRPPVATQNALDRLAWMDRLGSHWWPVLGGMYVIEAVKRVRAVRLVGLKKRTSRRVAAAPAVIASPSAQQRLAPRTEEHTS